MRNVVLAVTLVTLATLVVLVSTGDLPDGCTLYPDKGPCKALFSRYFYNATSGWCKKFPYGGCQGNANNFYRWKDCMKTCVQCGDKN
ncbi:hypothetical protein ACOMHN_029592 [Nucella lapillus]